MKTHTLSVDINNSREKVWEALWKDENYRDWTSSFYEGSYMESEWMEGGKAYFLAPSGEGMYSFIDEMRPYEAMKFKHIGEVKDGREMPPAKWEGAMESYILEEKDGKTRLIVNIDSDGVEWEKMLVSTFPKALERVKEIAESME